MPKVGPRGPKDMFQSILTYLYFIKNYSIFGLPGKNNP